MIWRRDATPCPPQAPLGRLSDPHSGTIDVILMEKENGMVISGGDDGAETQWQVENQVVVAND